MNNKTDLTAREKVMCYLLNRFDEIDQHKLASAYGVNQGRVAEAILAIEYTVEHTIEIYKLAKVQRE